jgi:hypothetical protein
LEDIDATITDRNSVDEIRDQVHGIEEGDFVRIRNARLVVRAYAAALPRARFASYYLADICNRLTVVSMHRLRAARGGPSFNTRRR